jgi:hypothetical protein
MIYSFHSNRQILCKSDKNSKMFGLYMHCFSSGDLLLRIEDSKVSPLLQSSSTELRVSPTNEAHRFGRFKLAQLPVYTKDESDRTDFLPKYFGRSTLNLNTTENTNIKRTSPKGLLERRISERFPTVNWRIRPLKFPAGEGNRVKRIKSMLRQWCLCQIHNSQRYCSGSQIG